MVRIVWRLLLEAAIVVCDLVRALFGRLDLKREAQFVPSRLGIGVVMEEWITMAACVDAARGLPVIQLNYLSYDERGHLRGPATRFAHRSLRHIDGAIKRVWTAAHRSSARHYAVWIYGDHGQETTTPYDDVAGRPLDQAVAEACAHDRPPVLLNERDAAATRLRYLRRPPAAATEKQDPALPAGEDLMLAAIGPIGHIYLPSARRGGDLADLCRKLAREYHIPLVLLPLDGRTLRAWTSDGEYQWPRDAAEILGRDYSFLEEATDDLVALCRHPLAGDIIIAGWRAGCKPMSFVRELGAHGGLGVNETGAFALLPIDAPVEISRPHLRPDDLRRATLEFLGRPAIAARGCRRPAPRDSLRVVTYNVHSCVGLDGRLSPGRIARVLAQCDADVVALQELDVSRARTGRIDQALEIARRLGWSSVLFHPAVTRAGEHYGDAIISRHPLRIIRVGPLPGNELKPGLEPRGAVWAAVDFFGREVQVVNTHLGLTAAERRAQVEALLGPDWLGGVDGDEPLVFCGDFNATPGSPAYRRIAAKFRDCQVSPSWRAQKTWFGPYPLLQIDHVFVRGDLETAAVEVPRNHLTTVASDHLPLVVELKLICRDRPRATGVDARQRNGIAVARGGSRETRLS